MSLFSKKRRNPYASVGFRIIFHPGMPPACFIAGHLPPFLAAFTTVFQYILIPSHLQCDCPPSAGLNAYSMPAFCAATLLRRTWRCSGGNFPPFPSRHVPSPRIPRFHVLLFSLPD